MKENDERYPIAEDDEIIFSALNLYSYEYTELAEINQSFVYTALFPDGTKLLLACQDRYPLGSDKKANFDSLEHSIAGRAFWRLQNQIDVPGRIFDDDEYAEVLCPECGGHSMTFPWFMDTHCSKCENRGYIDGAEEKSPT